MNISLMNGTFFLLQPRKELPSISLLEKTNNFLDSYRVIETDNTNLTFKFEDGPKTTRTVSGPKENTNFINLLHVEVEKN